MGAAPKHSGLGIASFIISLVAGGAVWLLLVLAGVAETLQPGSMDEDSVAAGVAGLLLLLALAALLVGAVLGIVGLTQNTQSKIFAILGTVFSGLSLLAGLSLLLGVALG